MLTGLVFSEYDLFMIYILITFLFEMLTVLSWESCIFSVHLTKQIISAYTQWYLHKNVGVHILV